MASFRGLAAFPLFLFLLFTAAATSAWAQAEVADEAKTHLVFCNSPERMTLAGAYADAKLSEGHTYTIFFHYKNGMRTSGEFVVALRGKENKPLKFTARQGMADPHLDPTQAGRQAMARFLSAGEKNFNGKKGTARFAFPLGARKVASGVITVKCESDVRLRIYFKHDKWTVPRASAVVLDEPYREIPVALTPDDKKQYFRIGEPNKENRHLLDGNYGMLYAFRVSAPEGRRIRVAFSPRGGHAGMVGSIGGTMKQIPLVGAANWAVFCEATVGKNGVVLTTAPYGGVFYPVELMFQLL